jgi:hypothetical protein
LGRPAGGQGPVSLAPRVCANFYLSSFDHFMKHRLGWLLTLEGLSPWWRKAVRVDAALRKLVLKP